MKVTKDDIGKKVTFKLTSCNWNPARETRVIRDVLSDGDIVLVRFNGFDKFMVRRNEVLGVD